MTAELTSSAHLCPASLSSMASRRRPPAAAANSAVTHRDQERGRVFVWPGRPDAPVDMLAVGSSQATRSIPISLTLLNGIALADTFGSAVALFAAAGENVGDNTEILLPGQGCVGESW